MSGSKKSNSEENTLHGIGVSPGVVIGEVFLMLDTVDHVVKHEVAEDMLDHEIVRFENALIETRRQINDIQNYLESRTGTGDANILDAHLMVLDDRTFIEEVIKKVQGDHINVEAVVRAVADKYAEVLGSLKDDYLRERVADIKDVSRRIIRNLSGDVGVDYEKPSHKHIVVASDLAPSDTASLRRDMVIGFATDLGSPTSHTAVMARALEIPAIVGLHNITKEVVTGDEVLIDGNKGVLIINPTKEQLQDYGKVIEVRENIRKGLVGLQHKAAKTIDGHRIILSANVETANEIKTVKHYGAEGVGLFRSEYLYLSREKIVGEEEQAEAYTDVALSLAPAPVIIRTLDIGGDKFFPGADIPHEANPFLGCRSIRLSLSQPDQFKMQLRAILRANIKGNVKIMYPMISSVREVKQANKILEEAKGELISEGVEFQKNIDVGVMIEIPAAALTADAIAEHVDFFSIGTNDLIQYTIAVDRVNERVTYLYEPTHPAVLKLIKETIDAAHRNDIWVGLCGEMAVDPTMALLLVGMGVDELSMAPSAVPMVKDAIRSVKYSQAKELADISLSCTSSVDVLHHCRQLVKEVAPEILELL